MTMVIKVIYNRCYGPEGGTRHLHQNTYGGESVSTYIERYNVCPVRYGRDSSKT